MSTKRDPHWYEQNKKQACWCLHYHQKVSLKTPAIPETTQPSDGFANLTQKQQSNNYLHDAAFRRSGDFRIVNALA
jgi:hypothetical protein